MARSPSSVAEALVREYLHAHGYARTMAAFEAEAPRSPTSLSNRKDLRRILGLEKAAARLKKSGEDAGATLVLLCGETARKASAAGAERSDRPATRTGFGAPTEEEERAPDLPPPMMRPKQPPPPPQDEDEDDDPVIEELAPRRAAPLGGRPAGGPAAQPAQAESWMMEDIDLDAELSGLSLERPATGGSNRRVVGGTANPFARPATAPAPDAGDPLRPQDARELKELCFAVCFGNPPDSWRQGFHFNPPSMRDQQFGLVQDQGGPCGLLASVQARMVATALKTHAPGDVASFVRATCAPAAARDLLREALTDAIVACALAGNASPTVALVSASGAPRNVDALLRDARVTRVVAKDRAAVAREVERTCLPAWTAKDGFGMVQFLLSAVLTRGVRRCRADMDEPTNSLLAAHGYCTQDMVNLLTLGQCVSNVHDGDKDLDGFRMRGVPAAGDIGLLTLFEWYGSHEVGSRLKNPKTSTWIVCSESHFSVLFALVPPRPTGGAHAGELLYYDGLHRQDNLLRLTLSPSPTGGHTGRIGRTAEERARFADHGREAVPPLEFVIETKWAGVDVDWNGAEKIL